MKNEEAMEDTVANACQDFLSYGHMKFRKGRDHVWEMVGGVRERRAGLRERSERSMRRVGCGYEALPRALPEME